MKVTRLQLLLILILLAVGGIGGMNWLQSHQPGLLQSLWDTYNPMKTSAPASTPAPVPAVAKTPAPVAQPLDDKAVRATLTRYIAEVGETYKALSVGGEIPTISQPLRAAKAALAAGRFDEAKTQADKALDACKQLKREAAAHSYRVAKGDTLWTIAARKSPVRNGAGWVAIWKANKRVVHNFDRIEIGWTLLIPSRPAQYATPYWKPPVLAQKPHSTPALELVDIRELPIQDSVAPRGGDEVDVAELPLVREASAFEASALRAPSFGFLPPVQYH